MPSFWKKDESKKELYTSVTEGLRTIYKTKLLPLEEAYRFHEFHSPSLDDSDFAAKPMVLLVGQYSVGKTTFIRYLLNVNAHSTLTLLPVSLLVLPGRLPRHSHRSR